MEEGRRNTDKRGRARGRLAPASSRHPCPSPDNARQDDFRPGIFKPTITYILFLLNILVYAPPWKS